MSTGKRREEWDRWGQLLCLVDNRTKFGKDAVPSEPIDWWPDAIVTQADVDAIKAAKKRNVIQGQITDLKILLSR